MKLLLISNSTNAGEPYLKYPMPRIDEFSEVSAKWFSSLMQASPFPTPNTKRKCRPVLRNTASRYVPYTVRKIPGV